MKYFAVKSGRETGIYPSWEEAEKQVKGYPGAKYKSFKTLRDAENLMGGGICSGVDIRPSRHGLMDAGNVRKKKPQHTGMQCRTSLQKGLP